MRYAEGFKPEPEERDDPRRIGEIRAAKGYGGRVLERAGVPTGLEGLERHPVRSAVGVALSPFAALAEAIDTAAEQLGYRRPSPKWATLAAEGGGVPDVSLGDLVSGVVPLGSLARGGRRVLDAVRSRSPLPVDLPPMPTRAPRTSAYSAPLDIEGPPLGPPSSPLVDPTGRPVSAASAPSLSERARQRELYKGRLESRPDLVGPEDTGRPFGEPEAWTPERLAPGQVRTRDVRTDAPKRPYAAERGLEIEGVPLGPPSSPLVGPSGQPLASASPAARTLAERRRLIAERIQVERNKARAFYKGRAPLRGDLVGAAPEGGPMQPFGKPGPWNPPEGVDLPPGQGRPAPPRPSIPSNKIEETFGIELDQPHAPITPATPAQATGALEDAKRALDARALAIGERPGLTPTPGKLADPEWNRLRDQVQRGYRTADKVEAPNLGTPAEIAGGYKGKAREAGLDVDPPARVPDEILPPREKARITDPGPDVIDLGPPRLRGGSLEDQLRQVDEEMSRIPVGAGGRQRQALHAERDRLLRAQGEVLPPMQIPTPGGGTLDLGPGGKVQGVPRFERTAIGDQGVIGGTPERAMPTGALKPTRQQGDVQDTALFGQARRSAEGQQFDLSAGMRGTQQHAVNAWLTDQLGGTFSIALTTAKAPTAIPPAVKVKLRTLGLDPTDAWQAMNLDQPPAGVLERLVAKSLGQRALPAPGGSSSSGASRPAATVKRASPFQRASIKGDVPDLTDPDDVLALVQGVGRLRVTDAVAGELRDVPHFFKSKKGMEPGRFVESLLESYPHLGTDKDVWDTVVNTMRSYMAGRRAKASGQAPRASDLAAMSDEQIAQAEASYRKRAGLDPEAVVTGRVMPTGIDPEDIVLRRALDFFSQLGPDETGRVLRRLLPYLSAIAGAGLLAAEGARR